MILFRSRSMFVLSVIATSVLGVSGCAKYKKKIADQSHQISQLEDENSQLKEENGEMATSNESLSSDKSSLEAENGDLKSAKEALEAELAACKEKIATLEGELKNLDINKEELSKELKSKLKALRELRRREAKARKRLATMKSMLSKFKKLIKAGKLNVKIKRGKMVLELPSAILFESGKAELSEEGQVTLKEVAAVLVEIRNREFQVAGHTDNVPIKSSNYKSNWELSTARAVTVVQFLQDNEVKPKFLSAAGYSQYQPDASNKTDEGKAKNRRIEITLMPDLDELPDLSDLEKELRK